MPLPANDTSTFFIKSSRNINDLPVFVNEIPFSVVLKYLGLLAVRGIDVQVGGILTFIWVPAIGYFYRFIHVGNCLDGLGPRIVPKLLCLCIGPCLQRKTFAACDVDDSSGSQSRDNVEGPIDPEAGHLIRFFLYCIKIEHLPFLMVRVAFGRYDYICAFLVFSAFDIEAFVIIGVFKVIFFIEENLPPGGAGIP